MMLFREKTNYHRVYMFFYLKKCQEQKEKMSNFISLKKIDKFLFLKQQKYPFKIKSGNKNKKFGWKKMSKTNHSNRTKYKSIGQVWFGFQFLPGPIPPPPLPPLLKRQRFGVSEFGIVMRAIRFGKMIGRKSQKMRSTKITREFAGECFESVFFL